jgi:UDP-N-acetylglucosamine acyltransferase
MGDDNRVREFASLHRGTAGGGGVTRIGHNNLLMAYVHVAHDCTLGSNIVMSNNATLAGHVSVDDGAVLGGLCAVHQFSRIGRHAFLGGMSGTNQDVPPYMVAVGIRGGLHGPNLVGLRRLGLSRDVIAAIRAVYRLIWLAGLSRPEALEQAEKEYGAIPQVMEIVEFVRGSTRGVLPAASRDGEDHA